MAWQSAAPASDLEDARAWLPLSVGGRDLVLAEVDGTWYAIEDRCTHAGCSFSEEGAELRGPLVECACHGSEFDVRTGEVVRGPAEYPVPTFPVRIESDRVEVDL
jgi:3-phenylpropionate/trans-cinnamate dioxygenase ferredoxin subunit